MLPAEAALALLRDGNERFVASRSAADERRSERRRAELAEGQAPHAAVLGCADSRVPPEIVFDQGLGDLFTVRVAGNVADGTQIDSLGFAVTQLECRLIVVLGHERCGAVAAALATGGPSAFDSVIEPIRRAIDGAEAVTENAATRANVRAVVARLRDERELFGALLDDGSLRIVGGCYCVASGRVEWLDDAGS